MYVIFEGNDGAGKSTTMRAVSDEIKRRLPKPLPTIHLTNHPGTTPLGKHLRQLVKYPEEIDPTISIDNLSRQILYMVDTVNFIKLVLEPAMAAGEWVFADRSSFISAIVYGTAEGLGIAEIDKLLQLITPPRADKLYILRCPWQLGKERLQSREGRLDHFERKPIAFFQKIESIYDNLITDSMDRTVLIQRSVALDDIVYVDATLSLDEIVDKITTDLISAAEDRG